MFFKSSGSATSSAKPLTGVLVVMLLASCMAADEANTEDVGHHYRRLEHLVEADNLTSPNQNFTLITNVVSGEERADPFIEMEKLLGAIASNSNVRKYLHDNQFITSRDVTPPHDNDLQSKELHEFKLAIVQSVNEDKMLVAKICDEMGPIGLANLAYIGSYDRGSKEWPRYLMYWLIRQASEREISPTLFLRELRLDLVQDPSKLFDGRMVLWAGAIERRARLQADEATLLSLEGKKEMFDYHFKALRTAPRFSESILHLFPFYFRALPMVSPLSGFWDVDIRARGEMIGALKSVFSNRPDILEKALSTCRPNWFVEPTFKNLQLAFRGE